MERGGTRERRDQGEDGVKLPTLLAAILFGAPWIEAPQENLGMAEVRTLSSCLAPLCETESVSSI